MSARMTIGEFEALFQDLSNWGRWGDGDRRGTLNYLTPERIQAAVATVRSGRTVSMAIPISTVAGPDNPNPAIHLMKTAHEPDPALGGVTFATDFLGMAFHGDCHTHIDSLGHLAWKSQLYGGRPASTVSTRGVSVLDIDDYATGIVGRGVLLDIPRLRGVPWLEPGVAVERDELQAAERAAGVELGPGDILVFRTGHHRRRLELGPWDNGPDGEGKAGLHPQALTLLHERQVAAFLPDGDGETVPSPVDGIPYPIHPLQIVAMGMACADSLQLEDLAIACEEERRWEFLVVVAPLRLPGGTGSPFNPLAIL
jgi:kynurenine formamidase